MKMKCNGCVCALWCYPWQGSTVFYVPFAVFLYSCVSTNSSEVWSEYRSPNCWGGKTRSCATALFFPIRFPYGWPAKSFTLTNSLLNLLFVLILIIRMFLVNDQIANSHSVGFWHKSQLFLYDCLLKNNYGDLGLIPPLTVKVQRMSREFHAASLQG